MKYFQHIAIASLLCLLALATTEQTADAEVEVVAVIALQLQFLSNDMHVDHQQLADKLITDFHAELAETLRQRLTLQMTIRPATTHLL